MRSIFRRKQIANDRGILKRRAKALVSLALIGEGLLALVATRSYLGVWKGGSGRLEQSIRWLLNHPKTTKLAGALEASAGALIASTLHRAH